MKKLFFIALMGMFTLPSMAQIQTSTEKSSFETIAKFRGGTQTLHYLAPLGYSLTLSTDNRFDDLFIIYIGENSTEAVESIDGMLYLINNLGKDESTAFNDIAGQTIRATFSTIFGGKVLWFSDDEHAGLASITIKELELVKEKIQKHNK